MRSLLTVSFLAFQNLLHMHVKPLRNDLLRYIKKRGLTKKFSKQLTLLTDNPRHPSLNTEILEPKKLRLYSFRVDRKYRAIFILMTHDEAEIVDINDHYQR